MLLSKPEKPGIWAYLKRHVVEMVMMEVHFTQPYAPEGPTLWEIADVQDPSDEDVNFSCRYPTGVSIVVHPLTEMDCFSLDSAW